MAEGHVRTEVQSSSDVLAVLPGAQAPIRERLAAAGASMVVLASAMDADDFRRPVAALAVEREVVAGEHAAGRAARQPRRRAVGLAPGESIDVLAIGRSA